MDRRSFIMGSGMAACSLGVAAARVEPLKAKRKPNFVVILIDDMGYSQIAPFGWEEGKTPHLSRMAAEGMKLTSFYMAAPVCTPARAALMTGCYPRRVGLDVDSQKRPVLFPKAPHGLNPDEKTIAEILKDEGYATGCFGKWHLGDQPVFLPTNHGFDSYFGIPYSNDMWPPLARQRPWEAPQLPVLRNTEVVDRVEDMDDQAQLCKRFTDAAVEFIRENRERPFFVYLPHAFMHGPRQARKEFMDRAGGDATRAQIEEIDWSAGQVLDAIRELGLAEDTLVIFTSDNGGTSDHSNKPLRGRKGSPWEGGFRVPTIAWQPGTVPANRACGEMATAMDLLPTFASMACGKVPEDRVIDGRDITPILLGRKGAKSPHKAFFYNHPFPPERENPQAVRSGEWKLFANGQLYHLGEDIGEGNDVAAQNPEIVARLSTYLDECRADLHDPKNCRPVGKVEHPEFL